MKTDSESGTTLIEVLITVVIIGVAFATLLSALGVSIYSSASHRQQANAETTIRNAAEQAQGATYLTCGNTSGYTSGGTPPITGVTVVVSPLHKDGSSFPTCTPATDEGLQKLTLSIAAPSTSLEIVKRIP